MAGTGEAARDTTAGERLMRDPAVFSARDVVLLEVREQLNAALHGPIGTALAAGAGTLGGDPGPASEHVQAQALLGAEIPRRFLATGAALTTAYVALAEGDEIRVGGALLAAEGLLFPKDPMGLAAVNMAVRPAIQALGNDNADADGPWHAADTAAGDGATAEMQRRVAGDVERLDRAYLSVLPHLAVAALGSSSWKSATGGAGPGSNVLHGPFSLFLEGMLRWTFYVWAALDGVKADDWARAGAALVAARRVTSTTG